MSANRSLGETNIPGCSTTQTFSLEFFHESSVLHLSAAGNFIPEISVKQPRPLSGPIRLLVGRFAALPRRYHVKNTWWRQHIFTVRTGLFFGAITLVTDPRGPFNMREIYAVTSLYCQKTIWSAVILNDSSQLFDEQFQGMDLLFCRPINQIC